MHILRSIRARGAEFITPPLERGYNVRAFFMGRDGHLLARHPATSAEHARNRRSHCYHHPMTAFLTAFVLVTIAEMADKTQLLTLSLACRYPARRVLVGVGLAIAVLNLLAVVVGAVAGRFIPLTAVKIGAGVLFMSFGLWNLLVKEKPQPEEECDVKSGKHVILVVLGAFLLAEIGDKTQLATLSLGARFDESVWDSVGVWLGATIGMLLANVLAVVVGHLAGRRIPAKLMRRISAALFIGFGIWTLVDALT